ncbi:hypothetical protein B0O80DRAFT_493858 [Mortierella sp. GBAus27b]|nr:hypothetical protein B0O80DRAFT_493858 [Mortierella sp. GBAus27b]
MGEVIQQGPDRVNGPVESQYGARKKNKKARAAMFNWGEEATLRGMDKEEISHTLDVVNDQCHPRSRLQLYERRHTVDSKNQGTPLRRREETPPQTEDYRNDNTTVDNFNVEDSVECIDISQLPKNKIVFAGTDPGVNVTCAQTLQEIRIHINQYQVLFPDDDDQTPDQSKSIAGVTASTSFKVPPMANVITAPQINEKPENVIVCDALNHDSAQPSLKTAQDFKEIDEAHQRQQDSRTVLKNFETSKARLENLHNQRLRTTRAWARLCAVERKYVQDHVRMQEMNPTPGDEIMTWLEAFNQEWAISRRRQETTEVAMATDRDIRHYHRCVTSDRISDSANQSGWNGWY